MNKIKLNTGRRTPVAAAALLSLLVSACGGGGTASDPIAAPVVPAAAPLPVAPFSVVFSGIAATGVPMSGASISVTDSAGAGVCSTTTASDGSYSCTLVGTVQAPFAVSARLEERTLYSAAATATSGTVNLTPLTTLIVARLTPSGDPSQLADAIKADPGVLNATKLQAKVDELKLLLAPVLAAVGDTTDPIRGTFSADGSGHDKVLDSLQVSIRPDGASSNIEITVKSRPGTDAAEPMKLSFKSTDSTPAPLTAALRSEDLVADGIGGLVNGLMGRLTACYAIPLAQRVDGVAEGAKSAIGGASAVKAAPCLQVFFDNEPATYKDNGLRVGSSGAFSGLFSDNSTGVKFDQGNYEYQNANGDIYITLRTTTGKGATSNITLTTRKQGGQLKVIGNQYAYAAAVRAYASDREFPFQPQFSWFGSGYQVAVTNAVDAVTRLPLFKEARVVSPAGRVSTYRPVSGRSEMGIVEPGGKQRVNSVQFLSAVHRDPSTTAHPSVKDGASGAFFTVPQLSDTEILALPEQGVWSVEWFHADTSKPSVVQTYRTISRARTLGELRQMKFVQLTPAFKTELMARTIGGRIVFGPASATEPNLFSFASAAGGDAWSVEAGAEAPITASIFGHALNGIAFNDSESVLTTNRKAVVKCTSQSATDLHCDGATGVVQFAASSRFDVLGLNARDARQVDIQKQVNLYRIAE